jgi:PAS domain-containing protein
MMQSRLQELCLEMAGHAEQNRYSVLAYLLQVAAAEAERSVPLSHIAELAMGSGTRHAPIGMWDWDISTNANYLNAICGEFFGKSAKAAARGVPQRDYLALVHPDDVTGLVETLGDAVQAGSSFSYDYRIILNDRSRWVRSEGSCSLDASGRPTRAFGSLVDITDLKRADERLIGIAPI